MSRKPTNITLISTDFGNPSVNGRKAKRGKQAQHDNGIVACECLKPRINAYPWEEGIARSREEALSLCRFLTITSAARTKVGLKRTHVEMT